MNKRMLFVLALVFILLIIFWGYKIMHKEKPVDEKFDIKVEASDLDINFLKLENNRMNIIYSPLSIKYALSMLKEGADGNTLLEIANVLGDINLPTYKNIDKVLSLANGIFIRDTFKNKLKKEYINTLRDIYNAEVEYDRFKNAKKVNNWIEDKTFKIIKNVIDDKYVRNEELKILLVNALAIDMKWKIEFDESDTRPDSFYDEDNNNLEVTMMHLNTESELVKYYQDDKIKSISLPLRKYGDTNLEFMAIMPSVKLSDYIGDLSIEDINLVISELHKLNDHLEKYYYGNEEGPFDCYLQCIKYKKNCEEKCVKKHIKEILRKIDEEGELYL